MGRFPWEIPMGLPRDFHETLPWDSHRTSTGLPWCFRDTSMKHGVSMIIVNTTRAEKKAKARPQAALMAYSTALRPSQHIVGVAELHLPHETTTNRKPCRGPAGTPVRLLSYFQRTPVRLPCCLYGTPTQFPCSSRDLMELPWDFRTRVYWYISDRAVLL